MPKTYDTIGNTGGGDPNIMKLEASNKVRPLDNLVAEWRQHTIQNPKDPEQVTMVVCPGTRSCPLCRKPGPAKPGGEPYFPVSRRYGANVWDYTANAVKVLIAGPQIFDEFKTAAKLSIEPSSCDWTIVKEGVKRQTKYTVVRHNADPGPNVSPTDLHDVAKYEAPESPERIFEILEKYGIDYDSLPVPNFTLEEALAFVMPYTQHKGLTIEKLLETDESFAQWMHGTKLEQGSLGDPVFIALQVAMHERGMVPELDEALAAVPEPDPAPAAMPAAKEAAPAVGGPGNGPTPHATDLPDPTADQIRMNAPDGAPLNAPLSSKASLLAAGFTIPDPLAAATAEQPDENTPTVVIIAGNEVTLPRIEAVKLVSFGTASYPEEAQPAASEPEPPKLPLPDEEVKLNIGGTEVPMVYAQAAQLVDSGSAEFVDLEVAAAHQRVTAELAQKLADKDDQQSVAEQAAAEHADPASVPAPEVDPEAPNVCPHCGKGYKSKGGLTQHINREHAGAATPASTEAAQHAAASTAQATPAPQAASTDGGADAGTLERVKDKLARAPFAKDYAKLLELFQQETGKKNIVEMTEPELAKLETRIDAETAAAA